MSPRVTLPRACRPASIASDLGRTRRSDATPGAGLRNSLFMTSGLVLGLVAGVILGQSINLSEGFVTSVQASEDQAVAEQIADSQTVQSELKFETVRLRKARAPDGSIVFPMPARSTPAEDNWLAAQDRQARIGAIIGLIEQSAGEDESAVAAVSDAQTTEMSSEALDSASSEPVTATRDLQASIRSVLAARPDAAHGQISGDQQSWRKHAISVADVAGRPMIAIVIDDLGLHRRNAQRMIKLPAPLTLAFMSYAPKVSQLTEAASAAGHELMVHVPMEPQSADFDPGDNPLLTSISIEENRRRLDWALSQFDGYVGINNHMGSAFTASVPGMAEVMSELKARGLLFLDSKTSGGSVGTEVAAEVGVPYAARDIFLDNDYKNREAIRRQLAKLEKIAKKRGYAVGIGHPHGTTIEVLAAWLPTLRERGFALVPVSAIVKHRIDVAGLAEPAG